MRTSRTSITRSAAALIIIALCIVSSLGVYLAGLKPPAQTTSSTTPTQASSSSPGLTTLFTTQTSSRTGSNSASSGLTGPEVWFSPLPYTPIPTCTLVPISRCPGLLGGPGRQVMFNGSLDYLQLFTNQSAWTAARASVNVFGVPLDWLGGNNQTRQFVNDPTLSMMFRTINAWGIKLATEAGALEANIPTKGCGIGVEGYGATSAALLNRVKSLGGVASYIPLDEPYYYGSIYSGKGACLLTPAQTATEVSQYASAARQIFPSVKIGDEEPLHGDLNSTSQIEAWIETYHNVSGQYFPFLHLDVSWDSFPNWPYEASQLQIYCEQRGIKFGVLFNGISATSNDQWLSSAESRIVQYTVVAGMTPDDMVFVSWSDFPKHALPESSNGSFTHLIDLYFRQRTNLTATLSGAPHAPIAFSGRLIGAKSGTPVASGAIDVRVTALNGSGLYSNYEIDGVFPQGTASAVLAIRVNTECTCAGAAAFHLYNVSLVASPGTKNVVANPDFSLGLKSWGIQGNGTSSLKASDSGPGKMLSVGANRSTFVLINSAPINVTAGGSFSASFRARVAPITSGAGYFAVISLAADGKGISRDELTLQPATLTLAQIQTSNGGSFSGALSWTPAVSTSYLLSFYYEGGNEFWPGYAQVRFP